MSDWRALRLAELPLMTTNKYGDLQRVPRPITSQKFNGSFIKTVLRLSLISAITEPIAIYTELKEFAVDNILLAIRDGFMVMIRKLNSNQGSGRVRISKDPRNADKWKAISRVCSFDMKDIVHKKFVPAS